MLNAILAIIAIIAVIGLIAYVRNCVKTWQLSYALHQDAHQILNRVNSYHPEFFKKGNEPFMSNVMLIELEFKNIPAYRHAFARMNVALEEAHPEWQKEGFSHVLNFYGNLVGVKNYVDITEKAIRIA